VEQHVSRAVLAEEAYRAGRFADALALAEAGLAAGEERAPLLRQVTLALLRLGRDDEAQELLPEVMVEGPDEAFMNEVAAARARTGGS
jgi:hypothetical protein